MISCNKDQKLSADIPADRCERVLALIDQHAADERCQVENLYNELCRSSAVRLPTALYFDITSGEADLFRSRYNHFESWGFRYHVLDSTDERWPSGSSAPTAPGKKIASGSGHELIVGGLPEVIAERCRLDPQILIDLLRTEIWSSIEQGNPTKRPASPSGKGRKPSEPGFQEQWMTRLSTCPKGLIDMVNSRACRSAIMFNDALSLDECRALVKRLSRCCFPFQCAHGRPSMIVLGDLDRSESTNESPTGLLTVQGGENSFGTAFRAWLEL